MSKSYSIEEIAEIYGIDNRKTRDWIRRGSIPFKKLPRTRRYVSTEEQPAQDVVNFIEKGEKDDL